MSGKGAGQRRAEIRRVLLALAAERGNGATFCPSEAARRLDPGNWRALMDDLRAEAAALQRAGRLAVTRSGRPVAATGAGGPIRLGLPEPPDRERSS